MTVAVVELDCVVDEGSMKNHVDNLRVELDLTDLRAIVEPLRLTVEECV